MDAYRMEREAQDRWSPDGPKLKFKIVGPIGALDAEWLDPYFGFFTIPSQGDGFFMVKQFDNAFPPVDFVWAEEDAPIVPPKAAKS
jgi:hypothetical protein